MKKKRCLSCIIQEVLKFWLYIIKKKKQINIICEKLTKGPNCVKVKTGTY